MVTKPRTCENQSNNCSGRLRRVTVVCACGTRRPLVCESCRDAAKDHGTCTVCQQPVSTPGLEVPDWKRDWEMDQMMQEFNEPGAPEWVTSDC